MQAIAEWTFEKYGTLVQYDEGVNIVSLLRYRDAYIILLYWLDDFSTDWRTPRRYDGTLWLELRSVKSINVAYIL